MSTTCIERKKYQYVFLHWKVAECLRRLILWWYLMAGVNWRCWARWVVKCCHVGRSGYNFNQRYPLCKAWGASYNDIVTLLGFANEDWNIRPHVERLFDFYVLSETEPSHLHRTSTSARLASPPCLEIIHFTGLPSKKHDVSMLEVVNLLPTVWLCRLCLSDKVRYLCFVNISSSTRMRMRIAGVTEKSAFLAMTQHFQGLRFPKLKNC